MCKLCKCTLLAHKKDLTLPSKSKKHLEVVQLSASTSKISTYFKNEISEKRKIAELKISAFIAEHCSVKTVDHLGALIKNLDTDSKVLNDLRLHRIKFTALIKNVIAPCFLVDLLKDISDSPYSLIIDESTSIDTKKLLCIMIKYFSKQKQKIETTFFKILEIESGDATTIADIVKGHLLEVGLKLEKLIGIGVDGASVMVGARHSVSKILKDSLPDLVVVKCICHSLHLAAEHACAVLPRHLVFIVKESHNWFSCSQKRQLEYRKIYELLAGKKPLKINKLAGTRWLSRYSAIERIIEQWDSLKLHFTIAKDKERCYIAEQLYHMFQKKENYAYLVFLKATLKKITVVNKLFQSDNVDMLQLFKELTDLLYSYLNMLIPPERLNNESKRNLSSFNFQDFVINYKYINFWYSFHLATSDINPEELNIIKQRCTDFLVKLCKELQLRIPDNMYILEKVDLLSPQNARSQIKPDITSLAVTFSRFCGNVDDTVQEWNMLHRKEWAKSSLSNSENFWIDVFAEKNAVGTQKYEHISNLALAVLTLPISNAAVERAFSICNIIKDKLRNTTSTKSAEAILRIRFCLRPKRGCIEFEPTEEMLKKFTEAMYYTEDEDDDALNIFSDIDTFEV